MNALRTGRGGHSRVSFVAAAVAMATLDFFDRYLKNDQGALERLRRDANQPGVATLQEQER